MSHEKELRTMSEGKKLILTIIASCSAALLASALLFFLAMPAKLAGLEAGLAYQTETLKELTGEVQKIVSLDLQTTRLNRDMIEAEAALASCRADLAAIKLDVVAIQASRFDAANGTELERRVVERLDREIEKVQERISELEKALERKG